MFSQTFRTSTAVVAGMMLAGSALVAPGAAAPAQGRAVAWGANGSGQLGNNSSFGTFTVPVAVDTAGLLAGRTVTAISASSWAHTCAVADGLAFCSGRNKYGQLGNNSTTDAEAPVAVDTSGVLSGRTVTAVTAGNTHTCAVADGKAYCWGRNIYGRLGNDSFTDTKVPVAVDTSGVLASKTITAVTAGGGHTCAIAEGRAYCWGANFGEVPAAVDTSGVLNNQTVTAISAGTGHTCAVADGRAYCWGNNGNGELGTNSISGPTEPVAVDTSGVLAGLTVTAISAGITHTCAVADGRAFCWGNNGNGELGTNSTTGVTVPVAVDTSGPLAGSTVSAIAAGGFHSCAVADGRVSCWGSNTSGQLGFANANSDARVPVAVDTSGVLNGKTVTAISAGGGHTAAIFVAAAPQPPTGVTGATGNGQVSVSWTPPADDGGSPVIDYAVTAIPGGATCTTAGTACVVSGLANGTPYTFTVTARNAIGVSAPSAPSAPVTPKAATPGKVTGVKAVVKKGTVKITWKPVPAATSYRVRISKPGGIKYKAWKTTSKRVFKAKVRKGEKYRCQVAAVGAGGRGPTTTVRFKGK